MKKIAFLAFLFVLSKFGYSQHCYGQNLVPNPSLDDYTICPDNYWQIDLAYPWTQPLKNSASTVLNRCMFDGQPTQMDTANIKKLHWRSNGMAALIVWADDNWRTYIEVPLTDTLKKNFCYYAEFWVLTHDVSYKVIDALGLYFSDTLVKVYGIDYEIIPIYVQPQIENPAGRIIKDTANWMKISGTFTANGTETAMIMGNFKPNNQIQWEILNNFPLQSSRYFFDDFLVCKCEDTIPPASPPPTIYLPNIFSPDGDGNNDVFYVRGTDISEMDLRIYNRWGNMLFESRDQLNGWDGRWQGNDCAEGIYFYLLDYTGSDGRNYQKKGNITMVR